MGPGDCTSCLIFLIFQPKDYENNGIELNNRFGDDAGERIPLQNLSQVPQFPLASQLPTDSDFSLFLPRHQEMATEVIDVLMCKSKSHAHV